MKFQVASTKKQGDWYKFNSIIFQTILFFNYLKKEPKMELLATMKKDEMGGD